MIQVRHPSVLNPWQIYRQAKLLTKHTSRATNPDWYRQAMDLDRQWHIWIDGTQSFSAVFDKLSGEWFDGPRPVLPRDTGAGPGSRNAMEKEAIKDLNESLDQKQFDSIFAHFEEDELRSLHEALARMTKAKEFGGKVKSLGVIIHVADEFALMDLAPEYSGDDDFESSRTLLQLDPKDVLGDASLDLRGNAWRLLPYWGIDDGERRAVAVQMSRHFQPLFEELERYSETRNIPVVTAAVSAPLEALRLAPYMLDAEDLKGKGGNIMVFQYRKFSALAVLNQTGELVFMRALQHRPHTDYPSGLGEILVNTAASVGLTDPLVTIVNMSGQNQDALAGELSSFFASRPPMNIGLVTPSELPEIGELAGGRVEMMLGDKDRLQKLDETAVYEGSETFEQLDADWAKQNFYGRSPEELEVYPTQSDLKMLKYSGYVKIVAAACLVGMIIWTSFDYIKALTTEAWKISQDQAQTASVTLEKMKADRERVKYWENVMARRSEGWLAMEVLLQLFPPDSGLIVSECTYDVSGEPQSDRADTLSFERTWKIEGYARSEGTETLNKLASSSYLAKRFEELANEFGAESLATTDTDTRTLDVRLEQRQRQMPPNDRFPPSVARHYRNSFEITITQEFTEKDDLALVKKPPKIAASTSETP